MNYKFKSKSHLCFPSVVVFIVAGEGSFQGYEYLEKNKIQQDQFPAKYFEESKHAVCICHCFEVVDNNVAGEIWIKY